MKCTTTTTRTDFSRHPTIWNGCRVVKQSRLNRIEPWRTNVIIHKASRMLGQLCYQRRHQTAWAWKKLTSQSSKQSSQHSSQPSPRESSAHSRPTASVSRTSYRGNRSWKMQPPAFRSSANSSGREAAECSTSSRDTWKKPRVPRGLNSFSAIQSQQLLFSHTKTPSFGRSCNRNKFMLTAWILLKSTNRLLQLIGSLKSRWANGQERYIEKLGSTRREAMNRQLMVKSPLKNHRSQASLLQITTQQHCLANTCPPLGPSARRSKKTGTSMSQTNHGCRCSTKRKKRMTKSQ